jgi:hypothetical protein
MTVQNLVTTILSPELQASIIEKLQSIKADLASIVITLAPGEKKEHLSVGNVMLPFLDVANSAANNHPEILSPVFDKQEFNNDYALTKALVPIATLLAEIYSSVENTLHAANSDSMVEGLDVYSAVQQNEKKVPGLDVVAAEMRSFFKKPRRAGDDKK